ncbi:hypothetical protein DKX38_019586 [Salix brachista]|uniref:3'-5' exonuclease domain-containing protein n=1 Tax=Salix brachista TaxID=2182728 RepID=A0A5N5KGP4_9ROSI|nr:hypothetical protein DKX38_019586 [Salix brachista]
MHTFVIPMADGNDLLTVLVSVKNDTDLSFNRLFGDAADDKVVGFDTEYSLEPKFSRDLNAHVIEKRIALVKLCTKCRCILFRLDKDNIDYVHLLKTLDDTGIEHGAEREVADDVNDSSHEIESIEHGAGAVNNSGGRDVLEDDVHGGGSLIDCADGGSARLEQRRTRKPPIWMKDYTSRESSGSSDEDGINMALLMDGKPEIGVARTRRQRATLAAYWVELNNLVMTPDQDIVTHVTRVYDLIQQIVFADASFTQYRNHDYMRMTLRRTLLPRDQQLLDEVWEGQINQNCYRNIIRAFLPTQIRQTLNRMMYNWGLPMEIASEIGRIASVDAIDWWRVEGAFPRRVRYIF